jgi:hypothetical protein
LAVRRHIQIIRVGWIVVADGKVEPSLRHAKQNGARFGSALVRAPAMCKAHVGRSFVS